MLADTDTQIYISGCGSGQIQIAGYYAVSFENIEQIFIRVFQCSNINENVKLGFELYLKMD